MKPRIQCESPGEALGVRVAHQEQDREGGEGEAERVQHATPRQQQRGAAAAAPATWPGAEQARGRCRRAVRGLAASMKRSARRLTAMARVGRPPNARVTQSRRAPARPAVRGQHHRHVGEGQGEDGVLELDRVEEVADGGHGGPR